MKVGLLKENVGVIIDCRQNIDCIRCTVRVYTDYTQVEANLSSAQYFFYEIGVVRVV